MSDFTVPLTERMKEKKSEESERGSALRMSNPSKKVARSPGAERM